MYINVSDSCRVKFVEIDWDPSWFANIPKTKRGFWASKQNQRQYFEELASKFNIKEPSDWGKLTFSNGMRNNSWE